MTGPCLLTLTHDNGRELRYWFKWHVDPWSLPRWMLYHRRPNYVIAQHLGRARDDLDRRRVNAIYRRARKLREWGLDVNVDHVVPLNGDDVCGLSHSANLRIIHRSRNSAKGNASQEHPDLFGFALYPHQLRLPST